MGKPIHYLFLLALSFVAFSCKRHVCPTYFTSFNIEKGAPEIFFNYYKPDTTQSPVAKKKPARGHGMLLFENGEKPEPVDDRMFHSQGKNQNGLMNKPVALLDRAFPKRKANFMKVVRAKITFPELDSLESAELYAVEDSMNDPNNFYRDQLIYMQLYGFEILDSMEAERARNIAKRDSLENVAKDKKLRKLSKKKTKIEKKMRKEGTLPQDEELSDADFMKMVEAEEAAKEAKRGRKKKDGEEEPTSADPDADPASVDPPVKEKRVKKEKKKKKDDEPEDPPP